jgi:tetratricopeptide (TPR) repeat protein
VQRKQLSIRESRSFMPGNREVFSSAMNAADRYRWDSRWTEAAQEYQRAMEEFPDDAMARSGLGFCYMQTKQWQAALEQYEHALQWDPSNVIALSKTAELYGILNRREDAYRAYLHLADLYSQAGQGARAEAAWQKAVQLSPSDPVPHERLAMYYFGKKDIPFMIQERIAAAQGYLQQHETLSARMQCDEVLRADPTNREARQLLSQINGQMQSQEGQSQQGSGPMVSPAAGMSTMTVTAPSSGPLAFSSSPMVAMTTPDNSSGGNTGIMGNAGNFGGVGNSGPSQIASGMAGGMNPTPHKRITASQVTGVLRQAQTFQTQGRFTDAIDLCEQILESGFDRPDARYFLGWLYQEQQRWDEAIRQFQMLLNDPDYALSCYYALGQCYRARGDLQTATIHFDEAVDRVNLDALTVEESDQLVQLCQEAAEAHHALGEQEQALTVYSALLGFLRSRGWNDKVTQVEHMLQQLQNTPLPGRPVTPSPGSAPAYMQPTQAMPPEQVARMYQQQQSQQPVMDAATMAFPLGTMPSGAPPPASVQLPASTSAPASGGAAELPDWLTGILSDGDKAQVINQSTSTTSASPAQQAPDSFIVDQPTTEQPIPTVQDAAAISSTETQVFNSTQPPVPTTPPASSTWMNEDAKPGNVTRIVAPEPEPVAQAPHVPQAIEPAPPAPLPVPEPVAQEFQAAKRNMSDSLVNVPEILELSPSLQAPPAKSRKDGAEELLSRMAGSSTQDEALKQVAEAVQASTASLPENLRLQVAQSMQDIQKYINHGLLTPATEECLRVIDLAPQYLDVHQVLCEIYVRQGKIEQASTKYGILVDTYIAHGRTDDAIATYRRVLQLEPNNLTYRMRMIGLLASQDNKEELQRERTLAAESYLRLGYMDRALTELEQALQESPTSVSTRLNYALALQKLGRTQQAVAEYQRVLQVDPGNITALVRWHVAMITTLGSGRANALEVLSRIRWQLRGEGQKHYNVVVREYTQTTEIYPNNADVHFALGQMHQQAGDYDKAIESYHRATRDSAVEVMAQVSSATCLMAQGKPENAIQQLEGALQIVRHSQANAVDPAVWAARPREDGEEHQAPEVEISLLLAKAYERTGRQEQMQAILRQVKQMSTYQDEVSSALAGISAKQGDIDSALQEYTELVRHYRAKRQIESAISVLHEMIRLAPQDPRAHDELADIYINRGLLDEAIAELRLLADIYHRRRQPDMAGTTLQRIGELYAEMGNNEEALINMHRAAELNPGSMDLLRAVVGFCLQLGRGKDAAQYQVIIARHYFETHQVKEAVAALQQLITIDKSNFEAYDMLGQTYQSVGEYEQASRVYRNLSKVNPENPLARERLAMLQELRTK